MIKTLFSFNFGNKSCSTQELKQSISFLDQCLELKKVSDQARYKEERVGKGGLIHPQYLISLLNKYAEDDVVFTGDGGSQLVWLVRHIDANGKRSLLHGTMANAMPKALGIQKAFPNRQVIAIGGDGGLAMSLGDLLTTIQEK